MALNTITRTSDSDIVGPKTFTRTSDADIVPAGTFVITSDATTVPAILLASDADVVAPKTFTTTSDADVVDHITLTLTLTSDAVISGESPPPPPPPPVPLVPQTPPRSFVNRFPCAKAITCPGTDSPFLNLSSEALDYPGFYSQNFGRYDPPLGSTWSADSCVGVVFSTTSQSDADLAAAQVAFLCALNPDNSPFWNLAQSCVYTCPDGVTQNVFTQPAHTFQATTQALADGLAHAYACLQAVLTAGCGSNPPGFVSNDPQTCSFNCQSGQSSTFTTPANTFFAADLATANQMANDFACLSAMLVAFSDPDCGIQPPNCQNPPCVVLPPGLGVFYNVATSCTGHCPDGSPFVFGVRAGIFSALNQVLADRMAFTYACRQAELVRVCLGSLTAQCCVDEPATFIITSSGLFSSSLNVWEIIAGDVPPGMSFGDNFPDRASAKISGTPTTGGNFSFTVKVTDPFGNFMTKAYTICVVAISPDTLPDANIGDDYSALLFTDGCALGPLSWQVTDGELPSGLSLDEETGIISGVADTIGDYTFTITVSTQAT